MGQHGTIGKLPEYRWAQSESVLAIRLFLLAELGNVSMRFYLVKVSVNQFGVVPPPISKRYSIQWRFSGTYKLLK